MNNNQEILLNAILQCFSKDELKELLKEIIKIVNSDSIERTKNNENIDFIINNLLISLSFNPGYIGFNYIKYILNNIIEKQDLDIKCNFDDLYKEAATKFNKNPKSIQKNIERCISHSWNNMDEELKRIIFKTDSEYRLSNSTYILFLSNYIKYNLLGNKTYVKTRDN